jgi:uncharacterized protein
VSAHLLDTNLLIALAWPQHIHHAPAHDWFDKVGHTAWATCPITQLAFVRLSSNPRIIAEAVSPREALEMLRRITALPGHRFWRDEVTPMEAAVFSSIALVGHRQVTDAYLLALAQHHDGKLATFDAGIAELIPVHKDRARHVTFVA